MMAWSGPQSEHDKLREAINWVRQAIPWQYQLVCDAAESTLPKTTMVEVWRVEYAVSNVIVPRCAYFSTAEMAALFAARVSGHNPFINVTGPHQQEVPT